jgi:hypothetical protein
MGHANLAGAVIEQAFQDARGPIFRGKKKILEGSRMRDVWVVNTTTERAMDFICNRTSDLEFWCDVAGVSVDVVVAEAIRLCSGKRRVLADNHDRLLRAAA